MFCDKKKIIKDYFEYVFLLFFLCSFSPSDAKFVTCSDDGTLRIWDFYRYQEERILRGKSILNFLNSLYGK